GAAGTELERIGLGGERFAMCGGRAVDAGNRRVAHGKQGLKMKLADEATADQSDPQRGDWRVIVHGSLRLEHDSEQLNLVLRKRHAQTKIRLVVRPAPLSCLE